MKGDAQGKGMSGEGVIDSPGGHTLQALIIHIVVGKVPVGVEHHLLSVFSQILLSHRVMVALRIGHGDKHQNPIIHEIFDPLVFMVLSS